MRQTPKTVLRRDKQASLSTRSLSTDHLPRKSNGASVRVRPALMISNIPRKIAKDICGVETPNGGNHISLWGLGHKSKMKRGPAKKGLEGNWGKLNTLPVTCRIIGITGKSTGLSRIY